MIDINQSSMKIQKHMLAKEPNDKLKKGINLFVINSSFILMLNQNIMLKKELLLSLMGIETNFGNYLGKMDILSSLATLSFDKRRSEFFTEELIIILK